MAVKKSVVRLDDSRFPNGDVFSVRGTEILENGFVGKLGAIEAGNRDVRALEVPEALDELVLIANPAMIYDNARMGSANEDNYEMAAGDVVRAYGLRKTFTFGVSKEGINGTAVVGQYLIAGAGHKLVPSATLPASGFAAIVVREDIAGGALSVNALQTPTVYVVLEVVQN
jgi:hypothetical protein